MAMKRSNMTAAWARLVLFFWLPLAVQSQETTCDHDANNNGSCSAYSPANHETKEWIVTEHTYNDFEVAGINLASYKRQEPFELFEDFDIGHLITGNEGWDDILAYRNALQRPSLSFYVDKVARKRWLPTQGFNIPRVFSIKYAVELNNNNNDKQQQTTQQTTQPQVLLLQEMLPDKANYCAKPTHMSLLNGNWLVHYDPLTDTTRYSNTGRHLVEQQQKFDKAVVASSLANSLASPPDPIESWALKQVKPGLVVEELWTAHDDDHVPPHEFNLFTIWGRLWTGQWNVVSGENRWCNGFIHRNGTFAQGSAADELPAWVDWEALVDVAERLGAHKDMFRIDVFVGVPKSSSVRGGGNHASIQERTEALQLAVSECEIFPTTIFHDDKLPEEATRLWIAGYKMGNYKVIPNTEVPKEFLETGMLSEGYSGE